MTRPKKKVEATTAPVETAAPTAGPETLPTINVGDLGAAAQYIDVAFRRGAFKAEEAAEVGTLFNKLVAFVSAYNTQVEAAKKQQEEKGE